MRKVLFPFFLFLVVTSLTFAQTKHAMTFDDLWAMKRIGAVALSPDGKTLAFEVTTYNVETNKGYKPLFVWQILPVIM